MCKQSFLRQKHVFAMHDSTCIISFCSILRDDQRPSHHWESYGIMGNKWKVPGSLGSFFENCWKTISMFKFSFPLIIFNSHGKRAYLNLWGMLRKNMCDQCHLVSTHWIPNKEIQWDTNRPTESNWTHLQTNTWSTWQIPTEGSFGKNQYDLAIYVKSLLLLLHAQTHAKKNQWNGLW